MRCIIAFVPLCFSHVAFLGILAVRLERVGSLNGCRLVIRLFVSLQMMSDTLLLGNKPTYVVWKTNL